MRRLLVVGLLLTVAALVVLAMAASAGIASKGSRLVSSPSDAPWAVLIHEGTASGGGFCSGSILDATHVLTAAHCTVVEGKTLPPSYFLVTAGIVDQSSTGDRSHMQQVSVAAVSRPPGYVLGGVNDDIALLTLSAPLDLSGPFVGPISLLRGGVTLKTGSQVASYGWGQTAAGAPVSDQERVLSQKITPAYACASGFASVVCTQTPTGSTCEGDSGGGLVMLSPKPVLLGELRGLYGPDCTAGDRSVFIDVSSPEIADWLRGVANPPIAPRAAAGAGLYNLYSGTVTCRSPFWAGRPKPRVSYEFIDLTTHKALTVGHPTYSVRPAQLHQTMECVVTARNSGGTTYAVSGPFRVPRAGTK